VRPDTRAGVEDGELGVEAPTIDLRTRTLNVAERAGEEGAGIDRQLIVLHQHELVPLPPLAQGLGLGGEEPVVGEKEETLDSTTPTPE
jgi:hypothetical protein